VLAGEHTAGAYAGLMEGALRSGLRAANVFVMSST
jgi:monoamine oxidase